MTPLELSIAVTSLANAIAAEINDIDQLALLSAIFGQLSATLATIETQRIMTEKNRPSEEETIIT